MTLSMTSPLHPRNRAYTFDEWDLAELREYIDWTPFFVLWELHGNYPAILDDDVVGEAARQLKVDADEMLDDLVKEEMADCPRRGRIFGPVPGAMMT